MDAILELPQDAFCLYVLAHGAGAGMRHPFMGQIAKALAGHGVGTLRYEFPYMERKSKRPDPPAVAIARVREAVIEAGERVPGVPLIAGGRSFGGRMTSTAQAAEPLPGVRGLAFLGFPLHPPGKPGDERAAHLAAVRVPMLFLQGSRDEFARLDLLEPVLRRLADRAELVLQPQEGCDPTLFRCLAAAIAKSGAQVTAPAGLSVAEASCETGVEEAALTAAAQALAAAKQPVFVYGRGLTRCSDPATLEALVALARVAGAHDGAAAAVIGVKGRANSLGAYRLGLARPFEVAGRQAVYVALGDDEPGAALIRRLQELQGKAFIVVQATYASEATALADVVLPVTAWPEQSGHYLNLEGRVQAARASLTPPAEVRDNVAVFEALADCVGSKLDGKWREALQSAGVSVRP